MSSTVPRHWKATGILRYRAETRSPGHQRATPTRHPDAPVTAPIRPNRNGWAWTGDVLDGCTGGALLAVWWHPETNQVRVARPPVYVPPKPPSVPPLRVAEKTGTGDVGLRFIAQLGYISTFESVEYDYQAAERLATENGSMDGWTWRKR